MCSPDVPDPVAPAPPPPAATDKVVTPEIADSAEVVKRKAAKSGIRSLRIPLSTPGGGSSLNIPMG